MVFQIGDHDVNVLRDLATSAGVGAERVTALQRRVEMRPEAREGAPYALLFGDANAMREFLDALIGSDLTKDICKSTAPVVVVGHNPQVIRPLVAGWPNYKTKRLTIDGLVILKSTDRIPEATLEALASLGTIDLGILVSRLSQPLNQDERKLACSLAGIVESIRIAMIGHPAEEVSTGEAGELAAYARTQARDAGFEPARFDGAFLWFGDGTPKGLPCEAGSPAELITVNAGEAGRNRDAVFAVSLGRLLDAIEERLANAPKPEVVPATDQDIERLISQFDGILEGLGKTLHELVGHDQIRTSEQARTYLVDKVQSWLSGKNLQATSLTLAEKFRPGVKAQLAAAAGAAAQELAVEPLPRKASAESEAAFKFLARHHWARVVAAAACGILTAFFAMTLLPGLVAVAIGALLGLGTYFVLGEPWVIGQGNRPGKTVHSLAPSPLKGWPLVTERLAAVFRAHMQNQSGDAWKKSLTEIRQRLVNSRDGS